MNNGGLARPTKPSGALDKSDNLDVVVVKLQQQLQDIKEQVSTETLVFLLK